MTDKIDISKYRKEFMENLTNELINVQPMPKDAFKKLYENAQSREKLIEEGYEPVSRIGLLWRKKS